MHFSNEAAFWARLDFYGSRLSFVFGDWFAMLEVKPRQLDTADMGVWEHVTSLSSGDEILETRHIHWVGISLLASGAVRLLLFLCTLMLEILFIVSVDNVVSVYEEWNLYLFVWTPCCKKKVFSLHCLSNSAQNSLSTENKLKYLVLWSVRTLAFQLLVKKEYHWSTSMLLTRQCFGNLRQ